MHASHDKDMYIYINRKKKIIFFVEDVYLEVELLNNGILKSKPILS